MSEKGFTHRYCPSLIESCCISWGPVGRDSLLACLETWPSADIEASITFPACCLRSQSSLHKGQVPVWGERRRWGHGSTIRAAFAQPLLTRRVLSTTRHTATVALSALSAILGLLMLGPKRKLSSCALASDCDESWRHCAHRPQQAVL